MKYTLKFAPEAHDENVTAKRADFFSSFSFIIKTKVAYLRPFLSYLPFPIFWKQNFMYFGHKHVETEPNCLHELATFFKYHMPLIEVYNRRAKNT